MSKPPKTYLFRGNAFTYAVLDGAAVPDLPIKLYEMAPPNVCLYRGKLSDELIHVAPYLVQLLPDTDFSNWVLSECWGNYWGIFAQSASSFTGMRAHFRSLLTVYDEGGTPMLFRYYDPRVLVKFVPTCTSAELDDFFGNVTYYLAEAEKGRVLRRYCFEENELKKASYKIGSGDEG